MSQSIIETIKQPGIIVVFDVDGVLAPYEWGKKCHHSMPDEEWNLKLANGEDLYRRIRPVKVLQDFISQKNIDEVYVCSKAGLDELKSKTAFCVKEYGIKPEKLVILDKIRDKLGVAEDQIAIVEDTVDTIDMIAERRDYKTIHVSSFL